MKIAIDFDDTIVCTKEKVRYYLDLFKVDSFKDEYEKENFYRIHIDDITRNLELKKDVKKILKKLAKKHDLYLITARSDYYSKNIKNLTREFIKNQKLPIKEIYFDCFEEGKADKCVDLNIDLFIDDLENNCLEVQEKGIDVLLFESECEGLKTAKNWKSVLKYVKEKENG